MMKDFRRALKYVWQFRGRVVAAWLCAIMVALLWAGTVGAVLPLFTIIFEAQPEGVSFTASAEGEKDVWTLTVSPEYEVEEGPEFRVEGKTVYVPPGTKIKQREVGSPLAPLVASAEEKLPSIGGYVRRVVDFLPSDKFPLLVWLMVIWGVIVVLHGLFKFLNAYFVGFVTQRSILAIRTHAYERIINVPIEFFSTRPISDVMSRFYQDCQFMGHGLRVVIGRLVSEPIRAGICLTGAVFFGASIDWRMPLIVMVVAPLCGYLVSRIARRMRKATRKALESQASIMGILEETLFGIRVVKAYTMEGYERRRFFRAGRRLWRQVLRAVRLDAATSPILETIFMLAIAVAVIYGGYLLTQSEEPMKDMTVMVTFFAFLAASADPVRKLAGINNRIQQGAAASVRVFELIDADIEHRKGTRGALLPRLRESIEFRGVSFSYPASGGAEAIKDINLVVPQGQVLAIVGRTGCGKSTLVSFLPRFYEPGRGAVLMDGVDIREATLRTLRDQIGLVTQDTILFADTVGNNIAYGWATRSRAEVGSRRPSREQIA
ncbi:MAG: ABC transporter ATP-binding protein, partial [Phycisphaerae bacterium]|nr:ABC transporter ATP-binding protein [Phycisphaerae bacterium]